jgi:ribosomal protein S12
VKVPKKTPVFNCFEGTLPGITVQAFTIIESVQPYNRGEVNAYLGRLAILSNIDKHRHLHLTKPQAHRRDEATVRYKVMNTSSVMRVEDGTTTKRDYDFPRH